MKSTNNSYLNTSLQKNEFFKNFFLTKKKGVSNYFFYSKWVGSTYISNIWVNFKNFKNSGVSYLNTNVVKFVNLETVSTYNSLFLRRGKIFNKGRYSRNRQFYRTGVYWCLYLSIILFTGLYYWFYHFIINFGFFW